MPKRCKSLQPHDDWLPWLSRHKGFFCRELGTGGYGDSGDGRSLWRERVAGDDEGAGEVAVRDGAKLAEGAIMHCG